MLKTYKELIQMKNKANRIMALAIAATLMIPCVSNVSAANKRNTEE